MLPGVIHVPFGSAGLDELEQRVFKRLIPADEIAAIVVEPIQGEGGYVVPDDSFLPRLRRICDENGILLVADEVQSGAGRTGKMWAVEHWDVQPDIVATAKGVASGMPLGAMIARADLMSWSKGHHGSTFGGNAVSCAAALATIDLLEDSLIDNAARRGRQAMGGLQALIARHDGLVREVRGKGLMIGVQFDSGETAEAVQWAAFERGLLVLEAGDDVVRLSPPLVVDEDDVETAVRIFGEAVDEVARDPHSALQRAKKWEQIDDGEVDG
jgi:4-aminobutyrate aminotransferase